MSTTFLFSTYACSTQEALTVQIAGHSGQVRSPKEALLFDTFTEADKLFVNIQADACDVMTLAVLEALFVQNSSLQSLWLNKVPAGFSRLLGKSGTPLEVTRQEFFQLRPLWVHNGKENITPETWTLTKEVSHPVRPRVKPGQILYQRSLTHLGKTLRLRVADIEKDLDIFHDWHNQPRVFDFWELNKPKEELREYLKKGLEDPHQFPVIVEFDETSVGYFEMYWTKEDRLGPYYDSEAFDRGLHFLIGNEKFLGFANTDAILKSVTHYLFLEEPRTRKIMAEPRSDNAKVLRYVETFTAWKKLKEFDFPHKRAALLECRREAFFGGNFL
ncbi:aerobactin siderophore biosynthesis protein iucB [Bdellovibrio bacteriovorus]|uniref:Aerobactin siderophore biosynthesis protein iucB n=1 Tax=Bdellovibrio bacteriovorus TaxID=959 RepID=A0A150WJ66_BDEBC|nr:GNAT family N-acetyltransferase [Bdellovibrio bacteriovorus]KYG63756.1 aerobactin siderophore biosynthesis protein iucB [Bdellovibrio bacteriovorus]